MTEPVAYRFKSPLSEEGQWEYGKEPPIGSRWEIEGLCVKPQWQGLTKLHTKLIAENSPNIEWAVMLTEQALKEKNT